MSGYDLYVFFLCFIVFSLLTALFSVLLAHIIKLHLKTIKHGLEDERITKEYQKEIATDKRLKLLGKILTVIVLVIVLSAFALSICVHIWGNEVKGDIISPKVVLSSSMSYKHKDNVYLFENRLDDQFDTFDLIFTRKLPGEFELELYDIVVYDYYGDLIIHRIIGIEEPNEYHPDSRRFLLQGDAVKYSDEYPVLYEQMKAIYRGERIPYVGSFFAFMQSPAGYLCILLVVFAIIATPIAEKKLWEAKIARLTEIGVIAPESDNLGKRYKRKQNAEVGSK